MPILLSAQRFSCTAGLGLETSELQNGVAQSLGWVTGDLPFFTPESFASRRRLNHPSHNYGNTTATTPPPPAEPMNTGTPFFAPPTIIKDKSRFAAGRDTNV